MRDLNRAIPDESMPHLWLRYDHWRARRHDAFIAKHGHRLPGWRTRKGARRLVLLQASMIALMVAGALLCYIDKAWLFVPFFVGLIGTLAIQFAIRIVTGSIPDAPTSSLDEIQLAQRNAARSIGFFVTYAVMFVPYAVLVGLSMRDQVPGDAVYATAILLVCLLLAAVSVPSALSAWWFDPPETDDELDTHDHMEATR